MENLPEFLIEMLNAQYGNEIAKQIMQGYCVKRDGRAHV